MPEELDFDLTELLKRDMTHLLPRETFSVVVVVVIIFFSSSSASSRSCVKGVNNGWAKHSCFASQQSQSPFRAALQTCRFGDDE